MPEVKYDAEYTPDFTKYPKVSLARQYSGSALDKELVSMLRDARADAVRAVRAEYAAELRSRYGRGLQADAVLVEPVERTFSE